MKSAIIYIALVLTACGAPKSNNPVSGNEYRVGEDFQSYIDRFEELSFDRRPTVIKSLIVKFGELDAPTVGLCQVGSGSPIITIDKEFWDAAGDAARENLMFHELGHCILLRDHLTTKDDGVPISLMFPSIIPYYYEKNPEPYIDELYSIYNDWFSLTEGPREWICDHGQE